MKTRSKPLLSLIALLLIGSMFLPGCASSRKHDIDPITYDRLIERQQREASDQQLEPY